MISCFLADLCGDRIHGGEGLLCDQCRGSSSENVCKPHLCRFGVLYCEDRWESCDLKFEQIIRPAECIMIRDRNLEDAV